MLLKNLNVGVIWCRGFLIKMSRLFNLEGLVIRRYVNEAGCSDSNEEPVIGLAEWVKIRS